jgi:hypothetical protein
MTIKKAIGYTLVSLLITGMLSAVVVIGGWKYLWILLLLMAGVAVIFSLAILIAWLLKDE